MKRIKITVLLILLCVLAGCSPKDTSLRAYCTESQQEFLDQSLEEAAKDLGAKPLKIFLVITLPLIAPAITSGFLLSVTLSMDDLVITSFLSGPGYTTLPQMIFSKIRLGLDPQMNVLATILIAIVGTLVIAGNYLMMRQITKRERETAQAYRQAAAEAAAQAPTR